MVTLRFPAAVIGLLQVAVKVQQNNISQGAVFFDKSAETGCYEVRAPECLEVRQDDFTGVGIVFRFTPQLLIASGYVAEHNDGRLMITSEKPAQEVTYRPTPRHDVGADFLEQLRKSGVSRDPSDGR